MKSAVNMSICFGSATSATKPVVVFGWNNDGGTLI